MVGNTCATDWLERRSEGGVEMKRNGFSLVGLSRAACLGRHRRV